MAANSKPWAVPFISRTRINGIQLQPDESCTAGKSQKFTVGGNITTRFFQKAQEQLIGQSQGTITAWDLTRELIGHAITEHGTVGDHHRLFIAGVKNPVFAAQVRNADPNSGTELCLAFSSISNADLESVINFGQPSWYYSGITDRRAHYYRTLPFVLRENLTYYSGKAKVPMERIYDMIENGSSDFLDLQDQIATAKVIVGLLDKNPRDPLLEKLEKGQLKVDGLSEDHFKELAGLDNASAFYQPAASEGIKGNTIYLPEYMDASNVTDRATIIHELHHARLHLDARLPYVMLRAQEELMAYQVELKYIFDRISRERNKEEKSRLLSEFAAFIQRSTSRASATELEELWMRSLHLAIKKNKTRYLPVIKQVRTLLPSGRARNDWLEESIVERMIKLDDATLEGWITEMIRKVYGIDPTGQLITVGGSAAESIFFNNSRLK